jgi:glucosamine--fructose-6-phosphate aminotransferase (isomerizing)
MQLDHTGREISTQVEGWQDGHQAVRAALADLKNLWQEGKYDYVIFTGCGSTYYLALSAAGLFQQAAGVFCRAVPSSEILLHPKLVYPQGKPLLVAISRSGATTETVQAAEKFKADFQSDVIVISCYADKPLNNFASINLTAFAGQEISIAQTRSFSSMLVMAEGFAQAVSGMSVPQQFSSALSAQIEAMYTQAQEYVNPVRFQRVFYLGSGTLYGLACEAMLKMKEMSLTSAEAFHPMEFRHGPKSMVDDQTLIIGLLDVHTYNAEIAVLNEMRRLGATVVTLSPDAPSDLLLEGNRQRPSIVHYMPFLQWLAYLRAVNKGLNPDAPRNLDQVVIL